MKPLKNKNVITPRPKNQLTINTQTARQFFSFSVEILISQAYNDWVKWRN